MNEQSWKGEHLIRCQRVDLGVTDERAAQVKANSKIDTDMLIRLARKGRYAAQIAREMGVSEFGIHRAAKRLGIELTKGRTGFKVGGWKP